jgi:uncharacterized protein (TIGR03067 family)
MRYLVVGLVVTWLSVCASRAGDERKEELKKHQGTWAVSSSTFDGQRAADDVVCSIKRVVADDRVVWKRNGKRFGATKFEVDPSREPKGIDVILDGGPNRTERVLGIYKLKGDELTICMATAGQPRPKEFKAGKGSGCTLRTYRREKPPARW